ncbi:hypothetical protein [Streptomyces sp. NPDC058451]|uniref:hypothetical protein n=1 Tax=Streptomyces sp. NPDC058451 TaxID=3346506 RepID=UPI00366173F4
MTDLNSPSLWRQNESGGKYCERAAPVPWHGDVSGNREGCARMALDERQISYLQGTLQFVIQADEAEQIQQRLEELGIKGTFKEI